MKTQLSKIAQSVEFLFGSLNMICSGISSDLFNTPAEGVFSLKKSLANKSKNIGAENINNNVIVDWRVCLLDKKIKIKKLKITSSVPGSEITLTNNEIKDIIKIIKSLENIGILLKGTTTKVTIQEGIFLNFLRPLVTAGLPCMKNVLTPPFMDQELQH